MQYLFGNGRAFITPLTDAWGNAIAEPTPLELGVLQDVSFEASWDVKELRGRFQFPVDLARGDGKLSGKAKFANINGRVLHSLVIGQTLSTGRTAIYGDTVGTLIPTTPFTITPTVPSSGTFAADLGVRNELGVALQRVSSAPATGQYSVSSGVYTFASADVGVRVYISFRYTLTAGSSFTVGNLELGELPTFALEFYGTKNGKGTYFRMPYFTSTKLSIDMARGDYTVPDFDLMGAADASGNVLYGSFSE